MKVEICGGRKDFYKIFFEREDIDCLRKERDNPKIDPLNSLNIELPGINLRLYEVMSSSFRGDFVQHLRYKEGSRYDYFYARIGEYGFSIKDSINRKNIMRIINRNGRVLGHVKLIARLE
ncbi:MAG: hypothetical protein ABIH37_05245 [archaeon]